MDSWFWTLTVAVRPVDLSGKMSVDDGPSVKVHLHDLSFHQLGYVLRSYGCNMRGDANSRYSKLCELIRANANGAANLDAMEFDIPASQVSKRGLGEDEVRQLVASEMEKREDGLVAKILAAIQGSTPGSPRGGESSGLISGHGRLEPSAPDSVQDDILGSHLRHVMTSQVSCPGAGAAAATGIGMGRGGALQPACCPWISANTRARAILGEFVKLEDFLPVSRGGSVSLDEDEGNLDVAFNKDTGSFLLQKAKKGQVSNIGDWMSAFLNYQMCVVEGIGVDEKTSVLTVLSSHAQLIQQMSRSHGFAGAVEFDKQIRLTAAAAPVGTRFASFSLPKGVPEFFTSFGAKSVSGDIKGVKTKGGAKRIDCFNCGEDGHLARDCTKPFRKRSFGRRESTGGPSSMASQVCYSFQSVSGCRNPSCIRIHKCAGCGKQDTPQSQCECSAKANQ